MDSFRPICSCHLIKIRFQVIFEYDFLKTQFRLFWNILFTMSEWWQWWSLEWILLALFFNSLLCTLYFNLFNPSKVEKTVWNSRIRFWRCCSISLLWVLCKYSNCKWAGCKKSLKKELPNWLRIVVYMYFFQNYLFKYIVHLIWQNDSCMSHDWSR